MRHLDIETAFLNGVCEEEIYMEQPEGYHDGTPRVLKLKKSLYGLKQAPRAWHKRLNAALATLGFRPTHAERCLYEKGTGNDYAAMLIYVDDLVVVAQDDAAVEQVLSDLKQEFVVKDLGPLSWYLGIKIDYNRELGTTLISQQAYINTVVERFSLENARPSDVPMASSRVETTPVKRKGGGLNVPYAQAIGCLLYIALGTRPDIAYAVQALSRHVSCPNKTQWKDVQNVIKYLKGTATMGIHYDASKATSDIFRGFSDASYADYPDRRSISGYIFIAAGGAVSWASRKQSKRAESTQEAELNAAYCASRDARWLRKFNVTAIGRTLTSSKTIQMYCDNQAAIAHLEQSSAHERTKHFDLEIKKLQEITEDGKINTSWCPTTDMVADYLTKPLALDTLKRLRTASGLF